MFFLKLKALASAALLLSSGAVASKRPNIIMILTDDQDAHMHSLDHMPFVQKYLINEGTTFKKHYCTIAVCCPARATILTGMAAHNTNVTDIIMPYGGYPKWVDEGLNDNYLPIWLQEADYSTYYVGKLFNQHDVSNYDTYPAKGWTQSDFLLDPYTYEYENAHFTRNGEKPVSYKGQYSPDVTTDKAYDFLNQALEKADEPFFLGIAPIAPHSDMVINPYSGKPPKYAARHAHLFKDYKIPRTENFNPDEPSGVSWISQLPKLNDTVIEYNDEYQRCRLRALQSVDEMVEGLIKRLDAAGQLENTYIFYTTDNGYHISQHRMHPGKECGFETDINIPMIVRGPGVPRGVKSEAVTAHSDLTPTFLHIAGAPPRSVVDGSIMPLHDGDHAKSEHVNIEFWGNAAGEGKYGFRGTWGVINGTVNGYNNNTYKGLRLVGDTYNLYYSVWCTNEKELYDINQDPGQIRNLLDPRFESLASEFSIAGRPQQEVLARLDALMMVLKSCKGDGCRDPWAVLQPSVAGVAGLVDALAPEFDRFYAKQPKVRFDKCELGYIVESEGPQFTQSQRGHYLNHGHTDQVPMVRPHWSDLV
ncbi:arylsulfatase [Coniochaeta sp. 2T2.1]|nr:arylsulfatase [Coniochaeta sp. 2T2.1]